MADEITKLIGDGGLNVELLFIYRGLEPVTYNDQTGLVSIIPTPSADLPAIALNILTTAEKSALDIGADAFEVTNMRVHDGMLDAELLAAAREIYAQRKSDFIERLNRKYTRTGQRFNAI